uniref:Uncharacterized protein n=1 Tax=Candidatus Kentrum sp. TC TaxID=2126339 RepID=A0A450YVU4_9GAMM|nr:MAG: hypothetical protein BECKTC1821E_GA0114239_10316 [Candidatus Kentron sp. TC]VFK45691.1 MAG: hypothetical protein BECKTC1821D_GA0114238_102626 [Candidatus Kentron sp. TC]VFK58649.1 MAG: hypothetical protein BECKTC1821F_GA0114240_102534 [Candidatus Kentron sp. TC]
MYQRKNVPMRGLFFGLRKKLGLFEEENWKDSLSSEGHDWHYAIADQPLKRTGSILNRFRSNPSVKRNAERAPCRKMLTLDKIREALSMQADIGGGYNRNSAWEILAQVECGYGQQVVDDLIREFDLESTFDFKPGSSFLSERG